VRPVSTRQRRPASRKSSTAPGRKRLYLTYPIDVLTSIKLGYATSETLDVTSKSAVVYGVGSRVITRTDGGKFGCVGQPRYVAVVYDHLGNLPADAQLAIKSVVSSVYRNRGSEGMKSETVGSFYSYTRDDLATATATDPFWQRRSRRTRPWCSHEPLVACSPKGRRGDVHEDHPRHL
jgi:hypothetical protein